MNRREFLTATAVVVAGGLAGCTALQSGEDETDSPDSTPTGTPSSESPTETTPTPTPEPFPDSCPEGPDIDGLPSVPESPTEENIAEFVTEFERVYAVATNDEYAGIADIQVVQTESTDGRFRVELSVEAEMSTPESGDATPRPVDARSHRALYRIQGEQVVRELRGHASGATLSSECWTVDSG